VLVDHASASARYRSSFPLAAIGRTMTNDFAMAIVRRSGPCRLNARAARRHCPVRDQRPRWAGRRRLGEPGTDQWIVTAFPRFRAKSRSGAPAECAARHQSRNKQQHESGQLR
jgi:hypothetical protein